MVETKTILLAALAVTSLFFVGKKVTDLSKPRGVRNNNPGNLRISNSAWEGKVPIDQNTDGVFEQFINADYGIRALVKLIKNKVELQGYNTIDKLINNYAPSNENDTFAYVRFVSQKLNIDKDLVLFPFQYQALAEAIIQFENGQQPYDVAAVIDKFNLLA